MSIQKRLLTVCLFNILLFFSASSMAAIFSYITSADIKGPSAANYYFVIQRWDPEVGDVPNPCYGWDSCFITINHRHTAEQTGGVRTLTVLRNAHRYRYMSELREAVLRRISLPYSGMAVHRNVPLNQIQECVGLFYQRYDNQYYARTGYLLPGSTCGIAPPPVGACRITTGSVDLDYGDINENELQNAVRSQNVEVRCNKDMSVFVEAQGLTAREVILRNNNSLVADLMVNNQPFRSRIEVTNDIPVPVRISSVLRTNGRVEPGPFSGSGALILTIP